MIRDAIARILYRTHGREVDNDSLMAVLGPPLAEQLRILDLRA